MAGGRCSREDGDGAVEDREGTPEQMAVHAGGEGRSRRMGEGRAGAEEMLRQLSR